MSKLKKRITIILFAVFALTISFAVTGFAAKAKADTKAATCPTSGVFEINDKVGLKLNEDGGMRWILKMDEAHFGYIKGNEAVELGFVIAPKNLMVQAKEDYYGMQKKIVVTVDKEKIYELTDKDGYHYANGCVINMKAVNRKYDYTAAAYIKNGETVEKQAAVNENSVKSFYNVSNAAILYSGEDYSEKMLGLTAYDWLGTEEYPIIVSDSERYETLKNRQNSGFKDKYYEFSTDVEYNADDVSGIGSNISRYGVETAPVAKGGLTYTGSAQELVEAGTAAGENCKIMYKVEGGEWGEFVPVATNAGEYTVYYKAIKDSLETTEKSLTVNIAKAKNEITYDKDANGKIVGLDFVYGNKPNETTAKALAGDITYTYTLVSKNSTGNVVEPDANAKYLPWSDDNISGLYKCLITASETENYKSVVADRWVRVHKADNKITFVTDANGYPVSLDFTFGEAPIESTATSIAGDITYTYTKVSDNSWGDVVEPDANAKYLPWSGDNTPGIYKCLITAAETDNYKSIVAYRWVRFHKKEIDDKGVKYTYNASNGVYAVFGYIGSDIDVNVLETFNDGANGEKAVKYLNAEAFAGNATITKVILPASVTELKGGVFLNCYNLKYISMTGVETLNDWNANNNFLNCINLETVIVGKMFEVQAQQFKLHGETAVTNPNIYVDGAKSESSISIEYGGDINNLLSGDVYYKGDASKCFEWNFDVNGNVVHGANAHNFVDGKCSACGKIQTEGVAYALDEANDCYYVSGYTGTSKEVYILGEYEGKPVSYVKFEAFKDNTNITKVVLPASVTDLDGNAFWGCTQLKYLSMVGVTTLNYGETQRPYGTRYGNNNFRDCVNLETVIVSNAFSSNVGQFGSGDSSAKAVVRFFVKGASGNPSLQDDQLLTGTVYFYSENNVSGAWHYVNGVAVLWA